MLVLREIREENSLGHPWRSICSRAKALTNSGEQNPLILLQTRDAQGEAKPLPTGSYSGSTARMHQGHSPWVLSQKGNWKLFREELGRVGYRQSTVLAGPTSSGSASSKLKMLENNCTYGKHMRTSCHCSLKDIVRQLFTLTSHCVCYCKQLTDNLNIQKYVQKSLQTLSPFI